MRGVTNLGWLELEMAIIYLKKRKRKGLMTEWQSWNLIGCGEGAGFPPHWDLLVWALKLWEHKWFGENSTKTFMPALVLLWRLVITSRLSMSSPRSVPNLWLSLAFFPLGVFMVHLLRQLDPQFPATLCFSLVLLILELSEQHLCLPLPPSCLLFNIMVGERPTAWIR